MNQSSKWESKKVKFRLNLQRLYQPQNKTRRIMQIIRSQIVIKDRSSQIEDKLKNKLKRTFQKIKMPKNK